MDHKCDGTPSNPSNLRSVALASTHSRQAVRRTHCARSAVFAGSTGAARDVVLLNAGAALYACERAQSLADGVLMAAASVDSGEAGRRLDALVSLSQSL